jgi:6-pyruvoyltetrahydropterin/6-carboxytetrahydropterin synthase
MFRLEKQFRFEAAHHLPGHDGKCARVHGHSWVGTVVVEGHFLIGKGPKTGMLLDYGDLSAIVKDVVEEFLDHHDLNVTLVAPKHIKTPTSEEIAQWLFQTLEPKVRKLIHERDRDVPAYILERQTWLAEVIVEETCTARCVFRPTAIV